MQVIKRTRDMYNASLRGPALFCSSNFLGTLIELETSLEKLLILQIKEMSICHMHSTSHKVLDFPYKISVLNYDSVIR